MVAFQISNFSLVQQLSVGEKLSEVAGSQQLNLVKFSVSEGFLTLVGCSIGLWIQKIF